MMERKKTLTMNWDGLQDDDDDDHFFESFERASSAVPLDLASSSDEDEDFEDSRMSFASTMSSIQSTRFRALSRKGSATVAVAVPNFDYDIWMADPGSITERRKRLLHGMGLDENKELLKAASVALGRAITKKFENVQDSSSLTLDPSFDAPPPASATTTTPVSDEPKTEASPVPIVLVRSRSDGDIDMSSINKIRNEEFMGNISKQRLTRTSSEIAMPRPRICPYTYWSGASEKEATAATGEPNRHGKKLSSIVSNSGFGSFFLIKNLDTGKEFIVNEYGEDGMWNRLSDLQTGKKLTMEEFQKTVGHSPVVHELMRRESVARNRSDGGGHERKLSLTANNYISKSLRMMSRRTGAALLKNIKGVASGFIGERERDRETQPPSLPLPLPFQAQVTEQKSGKNEWVRVRQSGKSHKEFSALHMCQEFQAHEGCIWTIKFSWDGHFLASAGEDKVIHIWEVQEWEVTSLTPEEGNATPIHPSMLASSSPDRNGSAEATPPLPNEKKKKGKSGNKKANGIPEYVHVPETVFSLSEKPYCSFEGHLDDILDLSWSKCQLLLSSSMDKTVRLWDMESKMCLKMFAHNDYVTCIQFNPIDDDYFISGSLDAKIRIWSIPHRQVVDWCDVHEMVTAVSYTPDGQAALVGTHKGSCGMYSIEDCKLTQTGVIELQKKKSQLKKITGFQFGPGNPPEVLVTSADSRIRIVDGTKVVHKFQGFRNATSGIAASFSPCGRHVISASEDSHVYVWKYDEARQASNGKNRHLVVTRSYEQFQCKDVSVAVPWPFTLKGDPPPVPVRHSKRNSKRSGTTQAPSSCESLAREDNNSPANSKSMLPPLPNKKGNNQVTEEDPSTISNTESGAGNSFANSSRMSPPIPKKSTESSTASASPEEDPAAISSTEPGIGANLPEEDLEAISRTESGIGDSFASDSSSMRDDDPSSISATGANSASSSWSASWSWFDSGHATSTSHPAAWGLVIATASFGGEIRCYQNFGLPRRLSRQGSLFGGPII